MCHVSTSIPPSLEVSFWGDANFNATNKPHLIGQDAFIGSDDFITHLNTQVYGHISDLRWYHEDSDGTGSFRVRLENTSAATNIAAGDLDMEFIYHPEMSR